MFISFLSKKKYFHIIAATIVFSLTTAYWIEFERSISGFFLIGETFPKSPYLNTEEVILAKKEGGYDGQMFLSLAFDPLMNHEGTITALDNPRYRAKRILLPALAYLLGFGVYQLIPWLIVLINSMGIFLIYNLYSKLLIVPKKQCFFALAIPGLWIVLRISTAEIIANLLVLYSYYLLQNNKDNISFTVLALACLAKETMLIFAFSYGLKYLFEKDYKKISSMFICFIPFYFWHFYLIYRFGLEGNYGETGNFTYPFYGVLEKWSILINQENNKHEYLFFLLLNIAMISLLIKIKQIWTYHPLLFGAALCYCLLFSLSSAAIYDYHLSYNRVFIPVFIILLLSLKNLFPYWDKFFWIFSLLSSIRVIYWVVK